MSGCRSGATTNGGLHMELLGQILGGIGGLGMLICFILIVVQTFQRGSTGLGIAMVVLFFCCTLGHWIGFIYGWVKSGEWGTKNIMLIWTVCIILWVIG